MNEDNNNTKDATKSLGVLLVIVFLLGIFVIIFNSDYRMGYVAFSNQDYYPQISSEKESK